MATASKGVEAAKRLSSSETKLARLLRDRIAESALPGETTLSPAQLDAASTLLIEAARERREEGETVLVRSGDDGRRATRIAVINRDKPFLVDSVAAAVAAQGLDIDLLVHPIVAAQRDAKGRLTGLADEGADADDATPESMIYIETSRVDAKERRVLEQELARTLADVRAAVADWPAMRARMKEDAESLSDAEGAELLRWFSEGSATLLAHVKVARGGRVSGKLGILRNGGHLLAEESHAAAFEWFEGKAAKQRHAPLIIKSNHVSRVHRRTPLDLFIVPVIESGKVAALSIHAGLWTSAALAMPPAQVPVLRRNMASVMEDLRFQPGSHDAKALVHALTILPHDVVIGFDEKDVARVATTMMALADRPAPRVALVMAPLRRHLFAFVWLPRDMMSTDTRLRIQELLENSTSADTLDWSLLIEGGNLALLRYVLDFRGRAREPDGDAIEAALQEMLRGWTDAVEVALAELEEPNRAAALAARYAEAFPPAYRALRGATEAAHDIQRVRALGSAEPERPMRRDARLYRPETDPADQLRLKIYQLGGAMPLSDAVPALENFGFRVLSEQQTELAGPDYAVIHDFRLLLGRGETPDALMARGAGIEAAICAVINARAEDDVFNRLVTGGGLAAQEADWLRATYRYLRQTGLPFTIYTVVDALRAAPDVTSALVALFRARHDPAFGGDRIAAAADAEEAIRVGLAAVTAINDDRLLRRYHATLGAILRTNAFAPSGQEALAFKFDSAQVPGLPRPVPWREIFVYSRRVEGIHLRAGPVARGGLRWSDRRDDFRTEILGLMKAQRVKNAVIVPTGAKGGFYPKQLPDPALDRDAWANEGRESYKLFIRTLLSITDNIVRDKVVHPEHVVIHDGEDPYFVVAADKGTASFSDTANAIAAEFDFWLGDAFASGGSKGYDHKAMGITARGAWLSVRQHFSELGVDVQSESVRVAGCGDMSGDVFGNGMLLSKAIRLVAAFDHRHIFIDPDPDPAKSWAERKRLFELPRSSWDDYAKKLISKGGGVYPRTLKTVPLTPEARALLGLDVDELDPESLISAILRAPVDLLWFGGIGTYIKAGHETNPQVGDPSNDALRVNGSEVRARVVGEGANLGVTQAGRIEFAQRGNGGIGGSINTDFIDNSAGVDCSDNEVNIKIALAAAQRAGKLPEAKRVEWLEAMTDEVAALVLEDNRLQALALSIAETRGASAMGAHVRLIETLEESGELDRKTEGLADSETLNRRAIDGHGLTRPELAVLLSTTKLVLQDSIETSDLPADDAADPLLLGDFPPMMQQPFRKRLLTHRLRPQIVGTVVANRMINRMGLVHPFELAEEEGTELDRVAAAFVSVCALFGMEALWTDIDAAPMPEAARIMLFEHAASALRGHMADMLRTGDTSLSPSTLIDAVSGGVADLIDHVDDLLAAEARDHAAAIAGALADAGAPDTLAGRVAQLFAVDGAIGLARLSHDTGIAPVPLTHAFIDLGERLALDWAQSKATVMSPSDPWERLLVAGLARDFQQMRFEFLRGLAANKKGRSDPSAAIERWAAERAPAVARFRSMIARAQGAVPLAPAMLAQIASQARSLLHR
ncbi:MAG TPA: NAD-glutamate dehydrogenase domain-containing protein [Croceibacterium sp.]|nr:NAD-glutamate dehydrogenase domain-containing protein [Croceibacterium sp.]